MSPDRLVARTSRRPVSPARLARIALIAGVLGCASGRPPPGAPPDDLRDDTIERGRIASRLHVLGTVHDGQGNPVIGASVRVHAHPRPRCIGGRGAFGTVRVRDDGWFMKTLYFYSLPTTPSCVVVRVTPPSGSSLMPDSVSDLMSEFRHGAEVDTVLVRMTLHRGRGQRSPAAPTPPAAPRSGRPATPAGPGCTRRARPPRRARRRRR